MPKQLGQCRKPPGTGKQWQRGGSSKTPGRKSCKCTCEGRPFAERSIRVRRAQARRTGRAKAFEHRYCLVLGQFPAVGLPEPGLHPLEVRAIAGLVEIRIVREPACAAIAHMPSNDVDA